MSRRHPQTFEAVAAWWVVRDETVSGLLRHNRFHQIPRMVNVVSLLDGDVISEELQRDDFQNRQQQLRSGRNIKYSIGNGGNLLVALSCHCYQLPASRPYLFHDIECAAVPRD